MDFNGQHKTSNFAPPKGQVAGSNPARDANPKVFDINVFYLIVMNILGMVLIIY